MSSFCSNSVAAVVLFVSLILGASRSQASLIQVATECSACNFNNCGQYLTVANNSCHSLGRQQLKVTCPDPAYLTDKQKQCATFRQWNGNTTSCSESTKLDQVSFTCGQCLPTGGKALYEMLDCDKDSGELNFLWECSDHTCSSCIKKTPFTLAQNGPGSCTAAVGALEGSGRYWQLMDVRSCYPTLLEVYFGAGLQCESSAEHVSAGNGQCLADFFVTCPGQPTNPPATFAPTTTPEPPTPAPTTTPAPPTPQPPTPIPTTAAPPTPVPITTPVPVTPIPSIPIDVRFYPEARCNGTGSDSGPEEGGTAVITSTGACIKIPTGNAYGGGLPSSAKAIVYSGCGDQLKTGIFKTMQLYDEKCSTLKSLRRFSCLSRDAGSQIGRCFLAEDGQYHKFDCGITPATFSDCGNDSTCNSCSKTTSLDPERCYPDLFPADTSGGGGVQKQLLDKLVENEMEVNDDEFESGSSASPPPPPSPPKPTSNPVAGGQSSVVVGYENYDAGPGIRMQVYSTDDCDPASLIIDQYTEERFCNAGIRAYCPGSRDAIPQPSPPPQTSVPAKEYLHAVVTGNCQDNFCGSCDAPTNWEDSTCYNIPEWERNATTNMKGAASFEFSCNNYTSGYNYCANVQVFSDTSCTKLINQFNPVCNQCKQDGPDSFFYIGCNASTGDVIVKTGCTDPNCNASSICSGDSESQPVGQCVSTPWPGVYHVNHGLFECFGVEQIYYSEGNCTSESRFFSSQVARDRCNDFSTISCRYSDSTVAPTTTVAPPPPTPVPGTPIPSTTTTTPAPTSSSTTTTTAQPTTTTTTAIPASTPLTTTTTTTSAPTTTPGPSSQKRTPSPNNNKSGNAPPAGTTSGGIKGKLPIIIGAGVGGLVLLVVLACVVRKCCCSSSEEGARSRSNSATESAVSLQDGLINASDSVKLCNLPEGPEKEGIRVRVTQFYKQHNPAQMDKVEKIWKYDMTEEELMAQLNSKYCSTN